MDHGVVDPTAPADDEGAVQAEPAFLSLDVGDADARALGILEREIALCTGARHHLHQGEHDQRPR